MYIQRRHDCMIQCSHVLNVTFSFSIDRAKRHAIKQNCGRRTDEIFRLDSLAFRGARSWTAADRCSRLSAPLRRISLSSFRRRLAFCFTAGQPAVAASSASKQQPKSSQPAHKQSLCYSIL